MSHIIRLRSEVVDDLATIAIFVALLWVAAYMLLIIVPMDFPVQT